MAPEVAIVTILGVLWVSQVERITRAVAWLYGY
jgi:hypothetical protein